MLPLRRTLYASMLAATMHIAAAVGIYFGLDELVRLLTPFNLLTMLALIAWTAPEKNKNLLIFFLVSFATGMITEIIGVQTAILFGHYQYGSAFGPKLLGVPFLIGVNWFVVVYASAMLAVKIRQKLSSVLPPPGRAAYSKWFGASMILDAAIIATLFDFIMEPGAVRLGFWTWDGGDIPLLNYASWFGISLLLLLLFRKLNLKYHPFAIHLLIIQAVFFLLVRS